MIKEKDINIKNNVHKSIIIFILLVFPYVLFANNQYTIEVELFPNLRSIKGNIEMDYLNSSKDTLQEVWIHLWPNAYRDRQTPWAKEKVNQNMLDFQFSKTSGWIDSLNFKEGNSNLTYILSEDQPDIAVIILQEPLLPGKSVKITTPFRVKFPQLMSRSGYEGSFFSVTQWYPKFAVYEDGNWQAMSYLEQGEFYSDFADYDVSLTIPSSYKFAATGQLFQENDTSQAFNTYRVQMSNIHDFAWYVSRKFKIKTEEIQLNSGKKVAIQAYVNDENILDDALRYTAQTIQYMSKNLGEYPYDVCTVVQGTKGLGSGMEYPTISNIIGDKTLKVEVIHEVAHNWWYGILANNERKEPVMDESITSYYENRIVNELFPTNIKVPFSKYLGLDRLPKDYLKKYLILNQYRMNFLQKMNLPAQEYSMLNYYAMIYAKGDLDFQLLDNYLGRDSFDIILQSFYKKYQFQHVNLNDLQTHFAENASKNTDWFFDNILKKSSLADIKVKNIIREDKILKTTLKNKSNLQTATEVSLVDKNLKILHTQWIDAFTGEKTIEITDTVNAYAVLVDPQWLVMEQNRRNNYYKIKGLHQIKPLQIRMFGAVEDPTKNQLFVAPILAGNKYDGFMLGLSLYNRVFPVKKLEYNLMPIWGFKSKTFNWMGDVSYHITPAKQKPVDIEIGIHSKSFTMNDRPLNLKYAKLQPYIIAQFQKAGNNIGPIHRVGYRNIQIWANNYTSERDSVTSVVSFAKTKYQYNTNELWYSLAYNHALYPSDFKTVVRFDKDYIRQSVEYKQKFRYTEKGSFVHLRLFAGAFLYRNPDVSFRSNSVVGFNLSGVNGKNDYLYDGSYFGRSQQEGLASRQIMMGEGNFKVLTAQQNPMEGKTVNGLFAINFKIDAPVKWLPIQIFADFGYSVDKVIMPENILPYKQFNYDMGLCISVLNEGIEIYFPLLMSDNFKTYYKSNLPKFAQRISFSIDLDQLNWYKKSRKNLLTEFM
jgi:hypothetical protein